MAFQGKVTWFFTDGNYGWTISLYNSAATYGALSNKANALAPLLANCLGDGAGLAAWRISDDTVFRDAEVRFYNPVLTGKTGPVGVVPALPSFVACLVRVFATPLIRRSLFLRGVPTNIVDGNNVYTPTPQWTTVIQNLGIALGDGSWQVKSSGVGIPSQVLTLGPPNNWLIADPLISAVGQVVRVLGTSRNRNPVGLRKVTVRTNAFAFSLSGVDLPADYVMKPLSLQVKPIAPTYTAILSIQDERITRRATGRPFALPRGRRSPVRV